MKKKHVGGTNIDNNIYTIIQALDENEDNYEDIYFDLIQQVNNLDELINYEDTRGKLHNFTLLMAAAYYNKGSIVNDLLDINANINIKNNEGDNAFMMAIKSEMDFYGLYDDMFDLLELLIEKGADINIVNNKGDTPLYIASTKDEPMTINLLIENDVVLDDKTRNNYNTFRPEIRAALQPLITPPTQPIVVLPIKNRPANLPPTCYDSIALEDRNINSFNDIAVFYVDNKAYCLNEEAIKYYKKQGTYYRCKPGFPSPPGSHSITKSQVHSRGLKRLGFDRLVYVYEDEFNAIKVGKHYILESGSDKVGRIIPHTYFTLWTASDYCETDLPDTIYTISELSPPTSSGGYRRRKTRRRKIKTRKTIKKTRSRK
jgi:hypothetical protein